MISVFEHMRAFVFKNALSASGMCAQNDWLPCHCFNRTSRNQIKIKMEPLIHLPLTTSCQHFQRCYVGPLVMKTLKLNIRSPAVVVTQEREQFICTVWPRPDQKEGFIQIDASVTLSFDAFLKQPVLRRNHERRHYNIRPIENLKRLSQLDIRLLADGSSDLCNFANCTSQLKTVLEHLIVREHCVVSMTQFDPLARQLGISAFIVENFLIESDGSSGNEKRNPGDLGYGIVTQRTEIKIVDCTSLEKLVLSVKRKRPLIGALSEEHNFLKDLIIGCFHQREIFKRIGITVPKGILLHGPPGVGKTLLVKSVAEDCGAVIVVVNGSEVFGPHPGESEENLRKAFQKAQKKSSEGAVILFIDELDALCPKRGMDSESHENRIVAQLLTLMDGIREKHDFVVIGSTNRPNAIDPALRRPGRFDREIIISVPSTEQRKAILLVHTENLQLSPNVRLDELAEQTNGYVGADLASLCREASFRALRKINFLNICQAELDQQSKPVLNWEDFQQALASITPSTQRQTTWKVDLRPVSWDEIGGLDDVKIKLKQDLEWPLQHAESFTKLGIQTPKGVLLYGPPGCCKTTLIFHHARIGAPSIIFFDEIDSIIGNRSGGGKKGVQQRVLATLLTEMDGLGASIQDRIGGKKKICEDEQAEYDVKLEKRSNINKNIILVAATNRPELMDSALMRPGRIDRCVYVPPPDQQARHKILQVYTKKIPKKEELDLEQLAESTHLYSGADLENLCREAALIALQQDGLDACGIRQAHFLAALQATKPSLSTGQIDKYSKFRSERS
ncbi:spermatogenesis-associated protein 5-like protein 1 isoform X2 [Anneissia japonica]|uniref:spermatogenesis-associated protein 5-like protein 1 isoform X2 n=1 Tax=Anneissia japonica TaxID=1529436 RepID=UPI0014259BDA|nr:spermatogenesis-associated protein 5-like protein 1 isoform X2 [Anneissia japonica]